MELFDVPTNPRATIGARYLHRVPQDAGHQSPFTNRRGGTEKVPIGVLADEKFIVADERACVPHR